MNIDAPHQRVYFILGDNFPYRIDSYNMNYKTHRAYNNLLEAQFAQLQEKVKYYEHKIQNTPKQSRSKLHKKLNALNKKIKVFEIEYAELFI